jgi:hypothetical protein
MAAHLLDERSSPSRPNVRSASMRKLSRDGKTWTPTEERKRAECMRQFCRTGRKGVEVSSGNSEAYQEGWERIFGKSAEEKERDREELEAWAKHAMGQGKEGA